MRFSLLILALAIHIISAQHHSSAASAAVDFSNGNSLNAGSHAESGLRVRNRRMYAMCPPGFKRIGAECYSLFQQRNSWLEAHFICKDKNAKLAEPQNISDRKLRAYLQSHDVSHNDPIWIGITYDWQSHVWQTSISGKEIDYEAFNFNSGESANLENHCAVYEPTQNYSWSARACSDKHRFLCQHKMPKVSERNRHRVYDRWNVTFPNQFANEVVLQVIDRRNKNSNKINRRVIAEGSNEEIVLPKGHALRTPSNRRHHQASRKPNNLEKQHPNDVNKVSPTPSSASIRTSNEVFPSNPPARRGGQKNHYDRKLERQREKEKIRKHQRMMRQKQKRLQKQQERKRLRQQQQEEREREQQHKHREQENKNKEIPENLLRTERPHADEEVPQESKVVENRHNIDPESERLRQESLRKQKEREEKLRQEREEERRQLQKQQDDEDELYKKQLEEHEKRLREENEQRIRQAEIEAKEQQKQIEEEKRRQDEINRLQYEQEEKRRREEERQKQEEEEREFKLRELEKQRLWEKQELERIKEEERHREELEYKRKLEIAKLEETQRKIAEEERRLQKEQEEAIFLREREYKEKIRREEEDAKLKAEEEEREKKQKEQERIERLNELKRAEEERIKEEKKNRQRQYAERIAKLSPEDQKKYLEYRKLRKQNKRNEQQKKAKQLQLLKNHKSIQNDLINQTYNEATSH